jgi:hypothetical protein
MIGRGEGCRAGYNAPGYANPVPRMGMGWQEAESLRAQADWLLQPVELSSTLQEFDEGTSLPTWGNL